MSPKTKYPSQAQEQFVVRLPDGMRSHIAKEADKAGRSMNAEVVQRLQESMNWAGPADRTKVYASGYISAIVDLLKIDNPPKRFRNAAIVLAKRVEAFAKLDNQEPAVRELASILSGISPVELAAASSELIASETGSRNRK